MLKTYKEIVSVKFMLDSIIYFRNDLLKPNNIFKKINCNHQANFMPKVKSLTLENKYNSTDSK